MNARDFKRYLADFRASNISRALSPRTIQSYESRISGFHRWFVEAYGEEGEITTRRIREWSVHRLESGRAKGTLRGELEALRTFCRFLVSDEIITPQENPMRLIQCMRLPKTRIEPLTPQQVEEFLGTFNLGNLADYRNYVMCSLVLETGLRASEVLNLTLQDVNLEDSIITVKGKGGKVRAVYLGETMRERLREYLADCRRWLPNDHDFFFPSASPNGGPPSVGLSYFSSAVRKKMDEIGLKPMHSTVHRLRHTFAVLAVKNGIDAFSLQRLLGHSDMKMTEHYVQLASADIQHAHLQASPLDNLGAL